MQWTTKHKSVQSYSTLLKLSIKTYTNALYNGITGKTHNRNTYFLSNRMHRVSVKGALSDVSGVTSGVPRGSVLYINDINENVPYSSRLFADDSLVAK